MRLLYAKLILSFCLWFRVIIHLLESDTPIFLGTILVGFEVFQSFH